MSAQIAIIGAGYVGLPLAVAFAEAGCRVTCVDVDAARVAELAAGRTHVEDVPGATLAGLSRRARSLPPRTTRRSPMPRRS